MAKTAKDSSQVGAFAYWKACQCGWKSCKRSPFRFWVIVKELKISKKRKLLNNENSLKTKMRKTKLLKKKRKWQNKKLLKDENIEILKKYGKL